MIDLNEREFIIVCYVQFLNCIVGHMKKSVRGEKMINYLSDLKKEIIQQGFVNPNNLVFDFLRDKRTNATRKLMINTELYRARIIRGDEPINISKGYYGYDSRGSFINPNTSQITAMRANRDGQPRLYCADVNYLALIEVRPSIGDKISLATLKVNDILTILDLTNFHIPYGMTEEKKALFADISKLFSTPVIQGEDKSDYLITQEIADFVASLGYDGIAFSSSLSPALNQENYNCCNLVIFNYQKCAPLKSNVVEMRSKYNVESADYDYSDFVQNDDDPERLNFIGHKEKMYHFNVPFSSKHNKTSKAPIGLNKNIFVSTSRQIYNIPVRILSDVTKLMICVGGSFTTTILHEKRISSTRFALSESLNDRINDLTLFFDSVAEEKLWFGDRENHQRDSFSMKISLDEYGKDLAALRQEFEFCKHLKETLLQINMNHNINKLDVAPKDRMQLDIIRNCVLHNMTIKVANGEKQSHIQIFDIQGYKVFLIFEEVGDGQYKVFDFFAKTISISCSMDDINMTVPQYSILTPAEYISASNINFNVISGAYVSLYNEANLDLPLRANEDVWNILLAYYLSRDSRFLHLATEINDWIISTHYDGFKNNNFPYINRCQIEKLKRCLDDESKSCLREYASTSSNCVFLTMVYILLNELNTAKTHFKKLDIVTQKRFIELPIRYLCPNIGEWVTEKR